MWIVVLAMLCAAAATAVAVLALPDPDSADHEAFAGLAVAIVALAAGVAVAGPRGTVLDAAPFAGVLLASVFTAVARPIGMVPLFYLWPILFAAYFQSRRMVIAVGASTLVSFAVALQWSPHGLRAATFLAVSVCTFLAATVVARLRERVDVLVTELGHAARTDPLTGLLNRRAFEERFDSELLVADRHERSLTLAMFDLDHFKQVNDELGHAAGDAALCRFAAALDAERRGSDVAARLGGEEFVVLFVETPEHEAHKAAERVAGALRDAVPVDQTPLSVSVGVAGRGGEVRSRDQLMRAADDALYEAKAAGRGRVASHTGRMTVTA